jgi:hypothetical protein
MTGWEDISCLRDQLKAHPLLGDPNRVLLQTCHGSMATSEQVGRFLGLFFIYECVIALKVLDNRCCLSFM